MISQPTRETLISADPDRMRSSALAEETLRGRLELFYAFHYELAKVPELVSEPMIGAIRYQWWRDVVSEIYEGRLVRAHEISTPLAELFKTVEMPRFWVDSLIDARERDLDPTPFGSIEAAKAYCQDTSGLLLQMAAHIGIPDETESTLNIESLRDAGEAWGLTGLARSWRFYHSSMLEGIEFDALCEAANRSYLKSQKGLGLIPPKAMPAISYVSLVPKYLTRMSSLRHNPELRMPSYTPLLKQFRLMRASLLGRI